LGKHVKRAVYRRQQLLDASKISLQTLPLVKRSKTPVFLEISYLGLHGVLLSLAFEILHDFGWVWWFWTIFSATGLGRSINPVTRTDGCG
jgi:hypothetical protein